MKHSDMIGIIMATKMEAAPFIKGLKLSAVEKKPVPVFRNGGTLLAVSNIGKSNAAIAATHIINNYGPRIILNLGAAGAAGRKFNIGAIMHVDKITEPDRPRLLRGGPVVHKPDTLRGFATASLATGDRPAVSPEARAAAGKFADLVDMEAAAIVQACRVFGTSVYIFKIVTDTAQSGAIEIIKNIRDTRDLLFTFYIEKIRPCI